MIFTGIILYYLSMSSRYNDANKVKRAKLQIVKERIVPKDIFKIGGKVAAFGLVWEEEEV